MQPLLVLLLQPCLCFARGFVGRLSSLGAQNSLPCHFRSFSFPPERPLLKTRLQRMQRVPGPAHTFHHLLRVLRWALVSSVLARGYPGLLEGCPCSAVLGRVDSCAPIRTDSPPGCSVMLAERNFSSLSGLIDEVLCKAQQYIGRSSLLRDFSVTLTFDAFLSK